MQLAIAEYLATSSYDSHLRRLRKALEQRKYAALQSLQQHLPYDVNIYPSRGGYFLWLELPPVLSSTALYRQALEKGISIAPGRMFTTGEKYDRYFRLNVSYEWDDKCEQSVRILSALIQQQIKAMHRMK